MMKTIILQEEKYETVLSCTIQDSHGNLGWKYRIKAKVDRDEHFTYVVK